MPGLPIELYNRCQDILLKSGEFESNASLRAVFVTDELYQFRDRLPGAESKNDRVARCLNYLLDQQLSDGRPVLPIFLAALRDKYQPGNMLRDELGEIVETIQATLASSALHSPLVHPSQITISSPAQTVTWLHLSDLHFCEANAYDMNVVLEALLHDIDTRIKEDRLRFDFIVVTGDIAFSANPTQYHHARHFFDALLQITGLYRNRLFVIPGTHDVDRNSISQRAQALGDSLLDRQSVNNLMITQSDRQLMIARFAHYANFINDYFQGDPPFDDEHFFYTRTIEVSGERIAILGLNSTWLCTSDKDQTTGLIIGERQVRTALKCVEDAPLKIALLYHHFSWLRKFDQSDSAALLIDNCTFILHGHLHKPAVTRLGSPDNSAAMISGGACYETRQYSNSYNYVQLDLTSGSGSIYFRRYYDTRGGFWDKDTLTCESSGGACTFALRIGLPNRCWRISSMDTNVPVQDITESANPTVTSTSNDVTPMPDPDLSDLRHRLTQILDDPSLDAFCIDHFPQVYNKFSRGLRYDEKLHLLLDHCRRLAPERDRLLGLLAQKTASPSSGRSGDLPVRGSSGQPTTAQLEEATEIQHRYALLIGVRDYVNPTYPPLPHTIYDVMELDEVLSSAGYTVRTLHTDQPTSDLKPTRANVLESLKNMAGQTGPGDLFMVYFGGHGDLVNDKAYLVPVDGGKASLDETGIDLDKFNNIISNASAQAKIVILDACYTGIGRGAIGMDPEFERHIYLEAIGMATLASCRRNQVAYEHDTSSHGVFTHYLLEGLRGAAARADQQFITFSSLNEYVTFRVKQWAIKHNRSQLPNANAKLIGDPPLIALQKPS